MKRVIKYKVETLAVLPCSLCTINDWCKLVKKIFRRNFTWKCRIVLLYYRFFVLKLICYLFVVLKGCINLNTLVIFFTDLLWNKKCPFLICTHIYTTVQCNMTGILSFDTTVCLKIDMELSKYNRTFCPQYHCPIWSHSSSWNSYQSISISSPTTSCYIV